MFEVLAFIVGFVVGALAVLSFPLAKKLFSKGVKRAEKEIENLDE